MPNPEIVTQRRTSVADAGVQKPTGVPTSVFDNGAAKPKRRRIVPPPVIVDKIQIRHKVPLPPSATGVAAVNTTAYRAVLARMKAGDSVELPERQARGLQSVAKKDGISVAARKTGDGTLGVWRLK